MIDATERLVYRDEDHTYWLDGRQLPSVTQLIHKHGLATDLSGAPEAVVRRAGEHGTLVHEEIENFIKTGERGITDEFQDFLAMVYPMADQWECEVMVYNDDYAGRVDLIGFRGDDIIVVDTKTGALNENATAWQVSMYANTFPVENQGFVKPYAFDAKMEGKSRIVPLKKVSKDCIDALIRADKNGELYNPMLPVVTANEKMLEVERQIATMESQLKELKAQDEAFKLMLLEAMENANVTKFEGEKVSITYVAPYTRTTVDSKALQTKYPDIYKECQKTAQIKASVRITVKE